MTTAATQTAALATLSSGESVRAYMAGKWAKKTEEFGDEMGEAALEFVTRIEDPESDEGKAMIVVFIMGWLGMPMA